MVIRACIQFANQEKIINLKQSRTLWKIVARNKIPPQRPRRTSIEQKNNSAIYFYSFTIAFLFSSTFTLLLVSSFAWSGSSSPPVGSNENEQVNVCDVWWLRKVWPISGRVLAETKKNNSSCIVLCELRTIYNTINSSHLAHTKRERANFIVKSSRSNVAHTPSNEQMIKEILFDRTRRFYIHNARTSDVHSTWITMFFALCSRIVILRLHSSTRCMSFPVCFFFLSIRYCCNSMLLWWTMNCNRYIERNWHGAKGTIPSKLKGMNNDYFIQL